MSRKIFVNLPVKDLIAARTFFTAVGYSFNEQFSDETGACMVVSDDIYAMLLTHEKFQKFIPHGISDARKSTEVLVALNCESREQVDAVIEKAVQAGATTYNEPQDYRFMYSRAFQDLDGHIWEYFWMSMSPDTVS